MDDVQEMVLLALQDLVLDLLLGVFWMSLVVKVWVGCGGVFGCGSECFSGCASGCSPASLNMVLDAFLDVDLVFLWIWF